MSGLVVLAAAGCGSGTGSRAASASRPVTTSPPVVRGHPVTVKVARTSKGATRAARVAAAHAAAGESPPAGLSAGQIANYVDHLPIHGPPSQAQLDQWEPPNMVASPTMVVLPNPQQVEASTPYQPKQCTTTCAPGYGPTPTARTPAAPTTSSTPVPH